jgi:hypothetical protein
LTSPGVLSAELAERLRRYADKIQAGIADSDDAEDLRQLASAAAGTHKRYSIKVHERRRGGQALGAAGVDQELELARQVKAYMDANGCGSDKACLDLAEARSTRPARGEKTLKNAWRRMGSLLNMSEENRQLTLGLLRLKAKGFPIEYTRTKRGK